MNFKSLPFCVFSLMTILSSCLTQKRAALEDTHPNDTLPPPYATKGVADFSKVKGWNGHTPKAPEGFTVTRYANGLKNPRWMYVGFKWRCIGG